MVNKSKKITVKKDKSYVKPAIKLETNMTFMFDAIKKTSSKIACRQCSSCHGCR